MLLVTPDDYELHTGKAAPEAARFAALEETVVSIADHALNRHLVAVERTELLPVTSGWVYVPGVPLLDAPGRRHEAELGRIWVGLPSGTCAVTYTGGFTPETCPAAVKRALCLGIAELAEPRPANPLPPGVASMKTGDRSVTARTGAFGADGADVVAGMEDAAALGAEACRLLAGWRRP